LLGEWLQGHGRAAEAERVLTESYDGLRTARGDTHAETVAALRRLIAFYDATGNTAQADSLRERLPQ
jgi:hypothetical protein